MGPADGLIQPCVFAIQGNSKMLQPDVGGKAQQDGAGGIRRLASDGAAGEAENLAGVGKGHYDQFHTVIHQATR